MEKISSIYRIFMLEKKLPVENSSNKRLFYFYTSALDKQTLMVRF